MRRLRRLSVFYGLCVLMASSALAQEPFWGPTSGPGGGFVHSLVGASGGGIMFAAVGESYDDIRLYRSADDGATWTRLNGPTSRVIDLAVSPDGSVLFAQTLISGFHRSTDGGETWTKLDLPSGAATAVLFEENGEMWVGTSDGVVRSSDNGDTWRSAGLQNRTIMALTAAEPGKIVAADVAGIHWTVNDGAFWEEITTLLLPTALLGRPNGDIYVGSSGSTAQGGLPGVYRLDANRTLTFLGLQEQGITALAINGEGHLFAGTFGSCGGFFCAPPAGVYRSLDAGATWESAGLAGAVIEALLADSQDRIVVATQGLFTDTGPLLSRGLLRSADAGATWTSISEGLPHTRTYDLTTGPGGVIYAAADQSLHRSYDGGATWTTIYTSEATLEIPFPPYYQLAVHPNGDLFLLAGHPYRSDGGVRFVLFMPGEVLYSADQGETWTPLDVGLEGVEFNALTATPAGGLLLATSQGDLLRSDDLGETWARVGTGLPEDEVVIAIEPDNQGRLFGLTRLWRGGFTSNHLFISTDDGQSWTPIGTQEPVLGGTRTVLAVGADGALLVGGHSDVLRLTETDNGWTTTVVNPFESLPILDITADAEGVFYITTWDDVLRSRNNGDTWESIQTGLGVEPIAREVLALEAGSDGYLYAGLTTGGVFRSTEPVRITQGRQADLALTMQAGPDGAVPGTPLAYRMHVYNHGPDSSLAVTLTDSLDARLAFVDVATTQGACTVSGPVVQCLLGTMASGDSAEVALVVEPTAVGLVSNTATITTATDPYPVNNTVTLVTAVGVETALEDHDEIPAVLHLYANYPNPFNPETRIPFSLPQATRVTLAVYDLLGREVDRLFSEALLPAGRHETVWHAADRASGIYIYKLIADGTVKAGRMTLVK